MSNEADPSGDLQRLVDLVERARAADIRVAEVEEELRTAKEELRRIVEGELPEAMDAIGMETFTARGLTVKVGSEIQVKQPPVDRRAEAHRWLRENGHGGMVKHTVEVAFASGEEQEASRLLQDLESERPGNVRDVEKVETSTLKAWLKRALEAGDSPPLELFGARLFRAATIKTKN